MQRLGQRVEKNYPIVRLYFDDVQKVFKLLEEHCDEVTIEAEGYKLESLDGLKEIARDKIRRLDLTGRKDSNFNYISIILSPAHAYAVLRNDDDMTLRGVFTQIDAILVRRAALLRVLASQTTLNVALAIFGLLTCGLAVAVVPLMIEDVRHLLDGGKLSIGFSGFTPAGLWPMFIVALYNAYYIWFQITRTRNRSVVYLHPWRERTTFWERNKDEILRGIVVNLVVAAIVGIVSFILGFILGSHQ